MTSRITWSAPLAALALAGGTSAQTLVQHHTGSFAQARMGRVVTAAGDVDADGYDDILVSEQWRAFVFSGLDGSQLRELSATGWMVGFSLRGAGDVDADGHDDIVSGTLNAVHGVAQVFSGQTGIAIYTFRGALDTDSYGWNVDGAGDVNMDGHDDVIVGATQFLSDGPGYVRVYSGCDGTVLYHLEGDADGDEFGTCVAGLGDVDHDGFDDFGAGAPGQYVRVFSGQTGAVLFNVFADGEYFAPGGDVDDDGTPDFLLRGLGPVDVFAVSGADGGVLRIYPSPNEVLGEFFASAGDVDGDGRDDAIIGDTQAEAAYVYAASDGALLFTLAENPGVNDNFGYSVSGVGDIDGDGVADFAVGATIDDDGFGQSGSAFVYSGACASPEVYCEGKLNSAGCVPAIEFAGSPTLLGADDFSLAATLVRNVQFGIFIYGVADADIPFGGGTLCVAPPVVRTDVQTSGGSPPSVADCSGVLTYAFTQQEMATLGLEAGDQLYGQFWYRDPGFAAPNNIGLSDALSFTICR